jgi:hypothetical protein
LSSWLLTLEKTSVYEANQENMPITSSTNAHTTTSIQINFDTKHAVPMQFSGSGCNNLGVSVQFAKSQMYFFHLWLDFLRK